MSEAVRSGWAPHQGRGLLWLGLALVMVCGLGLSLGTSSIDPTVLLENWPLVETARLPRLLLALVAGAGLAASGVTFQALLRNPLADPYIVGVAGGAALGGVLALVLNVELLVLQPLFAFGGAVLSVGGLFALARARGRTDPLTLLLAGVVFNAFAAAVVTFFKVVVSATKAQEILYWLAGSVGIVGWPTLWTLTAYVGIGSIALCLGAGALNLLALGDDDAASLGLSVEGARLLLFLAASMLVGAVVAVAGMIGFVGLVVPHILRRLFGGDHRWLVPLSLVGGATFLGLADTLARLTLYFFGTELPVGVITATTGGPFFLWLLLRRT